MRKLSCCGSTRDVGEPDAVYSWYHPEAHTVFGRDIIYYIIQTFIYYMNHSPLFSSMLRFTPDCMERLTGWTLIGCWVTSLREWTLIGCHSSNIQNVQIFQLSTSKSVALQILVNVLACDRAFMPRHKSNLAAGFSSDKGCLIHVSILILYGVVSPCRFWCERTVRKKNPN